MKLSWMSSVRRHSRHDGAEARHAKLLQNGANSCITMGHVVSGASSAFAGERLSSKRKELGALQETTDPQNANADCAYGRAHTARGCLLAPQRQGRSSKPAEALQVVTSLQTLQNLNQWKHLCAEAFQASAQGALRTPHPFYRRAGTPYPSAGTLSNACADAVELRRI